MFTRLLSQVLESGSADGATDCEWFAKEGFCKLDGRPCPYSNESYQQCPKFLLAKTRPDVAAYSVAKMGEQARKGPVHD